MNVILRGRTKEILETMVEEGFANSQSEAIRMAIVDFGQHYLSETELVNRKLDLIDQGIKTGKRKLLGAGQALGRHSKYVK